LLLVVVAYFGQRQNDCQKYDSGGLLMHYRLVAYFAHGRKLISFRLPALHDSPPMSFTLLNYRDQL
jgi:hypothetical protein